MIIYIHIYKNLFLWFFHIKRQPLFGRSHDIIYPVVIQRHAGVHAIFAFLCTFLPPAHDASQEPGVMNAVGVGASAVALTGVLGLIVISRAEHVGRDPAAAAALALRLVREGNFHLLQAVSRATQEARATPAAHRRRGGRLHQEFGESPGPRADGPDRFGEGDGAFKVNQGDVVVVQAHASVVQRVDVLLQNLVVLLCALLDAQAVLSCEERGDY